MLSALGLARAIEDGELTPAQAVDLCADAIAKRESEVGAFVTLDIETARKAAQTPGLKDKPLRGLPVALKDIFDTADMPTEYGSPIYAGYRPKADASLVALIRRNGGTFLGKTVTTEFAHLDPGKTRNPRNLAHTPGGSSSGSAAGVAAGFFPIATGTQTGGSVIRPAAYCGVIGYKPTFGDFSRVGIKMQCHSLDTLGLMARTLDDIALFRGAVLKLPPVKIDRSPLDRRGARPRIGFCRTPIWDEASPDTKVMLEKTVSKLADKGASVVDVAFAAPFADILDDHGAITNYEGTRNYADERLRNPDKVSKELMGGAMKRGLEVSFGRYVAAQRKSTAFRAHVDSLFDKVDVLVCPSAPGEAPAGVEFTGDPRFNSIWTLAGTPCVTLPVGTGAKGLPLGLQLVGLRHEDDRLLSTAAWVAAHLD